ncbi:UNVERIFIED_CONTAM: hypothetical protein FKN15_026448 [Acipenser sinensis]
MNTRCPPKRVPSAARFFTLRRLTVQPPQSYSVRGQCSSGQLTGKPAGAQPDYRGRSCAVSRGHPGQPNLPYPRTTLGQLSAAPWELPSTVGCGIAWTESVCLDRAERFVLSGSVDSTIILWALNRGCSVRNIYTYSSVTALHFIARARGEGSIVTGSEGGKVELLDPLTGQSCQSVRAHKDAVNTLQPHGPLLFSGSADGSVKVSYDSDPSSLALIRSLTPRGEKVYIGTHHSNIHKLDWRTGAVSKLANHSSGSGVTDCVWQTGDGLLLTSSFDLDTGKSSLNCEGEGEGEEGGKVELLDPLTGQSCQSVRAHKDAVNTLQPHGPLLFSGSADGSVKVSYDSDPSSLALIRSLTPRGEKVYIGTHHSNIHKLDWRTGAVSKLANHSSGSGVTDCVWQTGDGLLLTSSFDLDTGKSSLNCEGEGGCEGSGGHHWVTGGRSLTVWEQLPANSRDRSDVTVRHIASLERGPVESGSEESEEEEEEGEGEREKGREEKEF